MERRREEERSVTLRWVLIFLAILVLSARLAWAGPTSREDADRVVKGWLTADRAPLGEAIRAHVAAITPYTDEKGTLLYFVLSLEPEGYVIVAGDDEIEPIIAFSDTGRYEASSENPLHALARRDLAGRVAAVRVARGEQAPLPQDTAAEGEGGERRLAPPAPAQLAEGRRKARALWQSLKAGRSERPSAPLDASGEILPPADGLGSISDVRVAPLIQSRWSQSTSGGVPVYNIYTPNNYVCGCVATMMAQVLRYHCHPVNGVGTGAHWIFVNGSPEMRSKRGGEGSGGPYLWAQMPLVPSSSTPQSQREAISCLTYDAGLSVGMEYTASGSGAYMEPYPGDSSRRPGVEWAMENVFQYANCVTGGGYLLSTQQVADMLNPNLDAGCPVMLGIYRYSGGWSNGHAVVADGYGYQSGTSYHHINMGWAGSSDAWYNLPNIGTGYNFNAVAYAIYNVFPAGTGEILSGRVLGTDGLPLANTTVTATRSGVTYTDTTDANGIYGIARVPANASYTVLPSKAGYSFTSQSVTTGISGRDQSGNRWGIDFTGVYSAQPGVAGFVRLSGGQGVGGVTLTFSSGAGTAVTASDGSYSRSVPSGWSGTVTPSRDGYTFAPVFRSFTNVTSLQENQNFTAAEVVIPSVGGFVRFANGQALSGVTLTFSGAAGSTVTAADGSYYRDVPAGWSGTVTPSRDGYTFAPPFRAHANVTTRLENQNFTAAEVVVPSIAGHVYRVSGAPVAGVTITFNNGAGQAVTDAQGAYLKTVPSGWSGTTTPALAGFEFAPESISYTNVTARIEGQDYEAYSPILYVDADATGAGHGGNWTNAFTELRDALNAASPGDEIWVAEGTYRPANTVTSSFVLLPNLLIYGGFAGTESSPDDRNIAAHPTILSGDIGLPNNNADNVYTVVRGANGARLDGFVIRDGNARPIAGPYELQARGGGLRLEGAASMLISHCTFRNNRAEYGGSIYAKNATGLGLYGCRFTENEGTFTGAGIYSEGTDTVFIQGCTFESNTGHAAPGAFLHTANTVTVSDTVFRQNIASGPWSAMRIYGSPGAVTGCRFEQNAAGEEAALELSTDSVMVSRCFFVNNTAATYGGALVTHHSESTIRECVFRSNTAAFGGAAFQEFYSTARFVNCLFLANHAMVRGGAVANHFYSNPSFLNCTFYWNLADAAAGAVYSGAGSRTHLRNSVLWGNIAVEEGSESVELAQDGMIQIGHTLLAGGLAGIATDGSQTAVYNDGNNTAADPRFFDPENPEGADGIDGTADDGLRLRAESPAIGTGYNGYLPSGFATDLAGAARIQEGTIDRGAYEGAAVDPNQRPVAVAGCLTPRPLAGAWVQLTGSASYDPDGDAIVSYAWLALEPEGVSLDCTDPMSPKFLPNAPGTYVFHLIVTDAKGAESKDESSPDNTVTVVVGGLAQPVPTAPEDGLSTSDQTILFSWQPLEGASHYYLTVYDLTLDAAAHNSWVTAPETSRSVSLAPGHEYEWKMRALRGSDGVWSPTSESRRLSVTVFPAPQLLSPADGAEVIEGQVTLAWEAVEGADYYYLHVSDAESGATVAAQWVEANRTSAAVPMLAGHSYAWRVKALKTATGTASAYSETRTVRALTLEAPAPVAPAEGTETTDLAPVEFRWSGVAAADYYYLNVVNTGTGISICNQWVCAPATSYAVPLPVGAYAWKVKAYRSEAGIWSAWSETRAFTVVSEVVPAPTLANPAAGAVLSDYGVTLSWNAVENVDYYYLHLTNTGTGETANAQWIDAALTSAQLPLAPGAYAWRVKAYRGGIWSEWSGTRAFTLNAPVFDAPALLLPLDGATGASPLSFSWNAVDGADYYYLYVTDSGTGTSAVARWISGAQTSSSAALPDGEYLWKVRAYKSLSGTWSAWSETRGLAIEAAVLNAPVLASPAPGAAVTDHSVTLEWNAVPTADYYYLCAIDTGSGASVCARWIVAPQTSFALSLPEGAYAWKVRAYRSAQALWSEWSETRAFTLTHPVFTAPEALLPLDGAETNGTVVCSWTAVGGADYYYLYVTDNATGLSVYAKWIAGSSTNATVSRLLVGHTYTWRVRAYRTVGGIWTPYSTARQFIVTTPGS